MSTVPESNQKLIVDGELQIDGSAGYKESNALISFIGQLNTKLGQIRAFGYGAYTTLMMDGSDCGGGLAFRTKYAQGDTMIGGSGGQYPLTIQNDTSKFKHIEVEETVTQLNQNQYGGALLRLTKGNTNAASSLRNNLLEMMQQQMRAGETIQVTLGPSTYSGSALWSYTLPTTTSSSSADNYSSLSMLRNGTIFENIRMFTTGYVSIPTRLDVGTINATTYLNLPATDFTPLTLDKTNNRVGINNSTPTVDLDVTGDGKVSGTFTANTISATNYIGIPPPSLVPITLDATNNRVGINRTTPGKTLDVLGDESIEGQFQVISSYPVATFGLLVDPVTQVAETVHFICEDITCSGNISGTLTTASQPNITSVGTLTGINCSGNISGTLTTASQPNITSVGTLTGLSCSGNISGTLTTASQPNITSLGTLTGLSCSGTISASSYVGLPAPNVSPLTLNSINGFVGINKTPTTALDLNGHFYSNGRIRVTNSSGTVMFYVDPTTSSVETIGFLADTVNATTSCSVGSLASSGDITQTAGTASLQALTVPSITCSGNISGTLTTASQPNVTSVGTLSTLTVTGDVTIDSNTIKVDSANNRVGICTTTPTYNLDVTGDAHVTQDLTVDGKTTTDAISFGATSAPSSGQLGYRLTSYLAANTTTSATIGTSTTLVSLSIPAGTWLVNGYICGIPGSTYSLYIGLTTSSTQDVQANPSLSTFFVRAQCGGTATTEYCATATQVVYFSTSTTMYLRVSAQQASKTIYASGTGIVATRIA